MLTISNKIKKLPKKDLKKWIAQREKSQKVKDSQDWKDELAKLKERLEDAKETGEKGKSD
ncbi:MAG: hypothetical protein ACOC2F_00315 [Bacteroidota bacterium]